MDCAWIHWSLSLDLCSLLDLPGRDSGMIKAFRGSKRECLISAVKNAPVSMRNLRFAQELPDGWLVDFSPKAEPEKKHWYSIQALSLALGLDVKYPKPFHWDITYRERLENE